MENAEEIFHFLEEFSKRKPKTIPQELNEYLAYVARTGDPVYQWSLVKSLFKEKLLSVITDFYETTPGIDIPPYPNVDPFNYDVMKNSLLERLDTFTSAPFTVQRICELLTCPRKQYNRVDKFMRAIEKNILVVSTREPGPQRYPEPENGEASEAIVNGSDNNSEYNVDVEMEDMSWKDNSEQVSSEPQPSSSDTHISIDDLEARLKAKQEASMDTQEKITTQYESVTPPELNVPSDEATDKSVSEPSPEPTTSIVEEAKPEDKVEKSTSDLPIGESKEDVEMKSEQTTSAIVIPEIVVDDAETTEQKLKEQSTKNDNLETTDTVEKDNSTSETKSEKDTQPITMDESSSDSNSKEELDRKVISEVSTSSEESSSSSDNTDGNSNSPKAPEQPIEVQEEVSQQEIKLEEDQLEEPQEIVREERRENKIEESIPKIESDNYSISDVNSELPQPPPDVKNVEVTEDKIEENIELENVEKPKVEKDEESQEKINPDNSINSVVYDNV